MQTSTSLPSTLTLKAYIHAVRSNRKWLFGSLIAFILLATAYLIMKNPVYERSSQIMVKEDATPGSKLTAGLSMIQCKQRTLGHEDAG